MEQAKRAGILVAWISLVLFQSCAQLGVARAPDRTLPLSASRIEAKVAAILKAPRLEYQIVSRGEGKIGARKEYPSDPYVLPFLGKRMNERTLNTVRLEPDPEDAHSTNVFVDVAIEETESFNTGWVAKDAPEKREQILSTLLQRLEEDL